MTQARFSFQDRMETACLLKRFALSLCSHQSAEEVTRGYHDILGRFSEIVKNTTNIQKCNKVRERFILLQNYIAF